jgi:hypothetical protein
MMFISRESSQGFLEGSRRMFCNKLILSIDSPRSVEELPDFNLGLRIGSFLRTWGKIEDQASEPNRIVVADRGLIAIADDSIQLQSLRGFSPGFLGFSGSYGKPTVEVF